MPLYELICDCGKTEEKLLAIYEPIPACPDCHKNRRKGFSGNTMVKIKGEGGYPSRRKQLFNTTQRNIPKLS